MQPKLDGLRGNVTVFESKRVIRIASWICDFNNEGVILDGNNLEPFGHHVRISEHTIMIARVVNATKP